MWQCAGGAVEAGHGISGHTEEPSHYASGQRSSGSPNGAGTDRYDFTIARDKCRKMKTIAEKQTELVELYNSLDDPIMQYEFLLQLAGEVPVPDQKLKNDDTRIRNCQTDSWFIMEQKDGCLYLGVDSDALLIRGVLSIYVYLLDGRTLEEIGSTPIDFMEKSTIREQLSVSRFSVLSELPDKIHAFCNLQT